MILTIFLLVLCLFSASTKRTHECWPAAAGGGMVTEGIHRQASTSPVRPSLTAMVTLQPPASPSSSNVSVRKKLVGLWSYFYYSVYIFSDSFLGELKKKGNISDEPSAVVEAYRSKTPAAKSIFEAIFHGSRRDRDRDCRSLVRNDETASSSSQT